MPADRPAGPQGPASSSEPASVHVLGSGGRTRVVLVGDVDAAIGPELRGALDDALSPGLPVEVDLRHVTFMDSTGLGFLARLAGADGVVVLVGAPAQVRQLVHLAGLASVVRLEDAPAAAPADTDPADADPATA